MYSFRELMFFLAVGCALAFLLGYTIGEDRARTGRISTGEGAGEPVYVPPEWEDICD